jgi:hypothetical protein
LIEEVRRRAYLGAMQVASWLPRVALPFAAPSRPELLQPLSGLEPQPAPEAQVAAAVPKAVAEVAPADQALPAQAAIVPPATRPKIEVPRLAPQGRMARTEAVESETEAPVPAQVQPAAPPRFALQLLRAGACAVLVELPNGEPLQGRDPAYLLLKDLLRAAGLPESPQIISEPFRWPYIKSPVFDQGPDAARGSVQEFVRKELSSDEPCRCLWLIGLSAIRFAGEADEQSYNRELQIEGLGAAWALPGLELLMDEPERKRSLWQAMQRVRGRWINSSESN